MISIPPIDDALQSHSESPTPFSNWKKLMQELADLDGAMTLLGWDQEIAMPPGGGERRANQIATLALLRHERYLSHMDGALENIEKNSSPSLDAEEEANLRVFVHGYQKDKKRPAEFVARLAETSSRAQMAWEQAKRNSDFASFAPVLQKIIDLKREETDFFASEFQPYDALLDDYDRGLNTERVEAVFEVLEPELRKLHKELQAGSEPEDRFLHQTVDSETQLQLTSDVLDLFGFDRHHCRQDLSAHPFSTALSMEDVRITTRINPNNLLDGLLSTIHEYGHSLYERQLNPKWYGLPQGGAHSLSIHESQSRFWENEIGRSEAFVELIFDRLAACFPDRLQGQTPNSVFRAINKVELSKIRTQADELTYHLHIILRFRLESMLIAGDFNAKDLPELWNDMMQNMLGAKPQSDAEGVLQDIHWSMGSFGYFPTYTLGSLYASQWSHQIGLELGSPLQNLVRDGNFVPIQAWLGKRIHEHGSLYTAEELSQRVMGHPLDPNYFISALRHKLEIVYGLAPQQS